MKKIKFEESTANVENEASMQVKRVIAALDSGLKPLQVLSRISSVLALKFKPEWSTGPRKRTFSASGTPTSNKQAEIDALKDICEGSVGRQSSPSVQIEEMKAVLRAERSPFKALVLITLIVEPEGVVQFLLGRAGVTVS